MMFDWTAEKVNDVILADHSSDSIPIHGNFNVHHKEQLLHSNKSEEQDKYYHAFSIAYKLIQIMDDPTHVPDIAGH